MKNTLNDRINAAMDLGLTEEEAKQMCMSADLTEDVDDVDNDSDVAEFIEELESGAWDEEPEQIDEAEKDTSSLNAWDVVICVSPTIHIFRPAVIYEVCKGYCQVLFCLHNELRVQKDGSKMMISDYYEKHPEKGIDPLILSDWREEGFPKTTFVNISQSYKVWNNNIDMKKGAVGKLTDHDIDKILRAIDLKEDDYVSEKLKQRIGE